MPSMASGKIMGKNPKQPQRSQRAQRVLRILNDLHGVDIRRQTKDKTKTPVFLCALCALCG
jgi:hypothetical protein